MAILHSLKAIALVIVLLIIVSFVGMPVHATGTTASAPFPKPADIFIQQPAWPNVDPALTDKAHASIIGLATQPTD